MKKLGLGKGMALVLSPVLLVQAGVVQADTAEQLAVCKTELKALYGEGTRVRMYGTKSYRGVETLKLKVTPEGEASMTLQCSSDLESDDRVVLKDKNGEMLVS
jgi:hypothetical protein